MLLLVSLLSCQEWGKTGILSTIPTLANLERYVAHAFTEHQIKSELLDSAATFFIAKLKYQWVGYAKLNQSPPPKCIRQLPAIELSRLYTMQLYLGSGIGLALLEACTSYAHSKAFKTDYLVFKVIELSRFCGYSYCGNTGYNPPQTVGCCICYKLFSSGLSVNSFNRCLRP